MIDVGTGAGFPGLVLKIAKPEIKLTLLDSLNKRINFLKDVCEKVDINDVEFVHSRAEDGGKNRDYRGKFDTDCAFGVVYSVFETRRLLPCFERSVGRAGSKGR